ncbi:MULTISPECIES: 50S ribosomal protein L24e [Haloarcula]|uniref:Large ribosomal subunit protein eL24 n=1 Tax=Haloarcula pellucida TaxID=1427151 RepID=A0A830GJK1_9EURY|nr:MULTISPECIES: 50S ribosomal protein L24e [Halomicroarcula]MBX0347786.1 50S ribosomal protein L24e [Halomicroarcula pellucida]MDS0276281.1 50S ribosomal protein L24e [Halomicroarcula sp. S1AR25-4]GGN90289.1 hypothetical protein GCM10009030_12100 [Halomicroarcula pellucida]
MPQTRECDYCGADIEPGTGTMLVRNDGTTIHFCSSKCENNADLGREARNLGWTESGYNASGEKQAEDESATEAADADENDDVDAAPDLEAAEEDVETADDDGDEDDEEEAEEAEA